MDTCNHAGAGLVSGRRDTVLGVLDRINEQFKIHADALGVLSSQLELVMMSSDAEYDPPARCGEWSESSVVDRLLSLEARLRLHTWCVDQMNSRLEIG